jgi:hypothetical protein
MGLMKITEFVPKTEILEQFYSIQNKKNLIKVIQRQRRFISIMQEGKDPMYFRSNGAVLNKPFLPPR